MKGPTYNGEILGTSELNEPESSMFQSETPPRACKLLGERDLASA